MAESVPGITPDNIKPCRIPDKARTILNRFISASRTPGGIFVLRMTQDTKIKRFNRLCQNTAHLQPEVFFSI